MVYISFKPIRNNKLNNMNLKEIYSKYGLEKDDFFKIEISIGMIKEFSIFTKLSRSGYCNLTAL